MLIIVSLVELYTMGGGTVDAGDEDDIILHKKQRTFVESAEYHETKYKRPPAPIN